MFSFHAFLNDSFVGIPMFLLVPVGSLKMISVEVCNFVLVFFAESDVLCAESVFEENLLASIEIFWLLLWDIHCRT